MLLDKFPKVKALLLDLDGVLWRDVKPIGDIPKIINRIDALGLKYLFATNNATKTIDEFVDKFRGFGLDLSPDQIINSSQAVGAYLSKHFPNGGNIYVVGPPSLITTLAKYGFIHQNDMENKNIVAVVGSMDYELTYEKIKQAGLLIRSGSLFIGTNSDATYPTPSGLWPGAGTIVRAIETASETKPIIIGKPEPALFNLGFEKLGLRPEQTMVVGDRLETDIAGGQAAGCLTCLVLSGVSKQAQADKWRPKPDIICDNLEALLK
ncbi:MAG: HAD-IIA family hydrolase [Anaerolineaceae bacterium]|nr:HAD-IIA family hydrolase [Anaerolineaceae bacterium]